MNRSFSVNSSSLTSARLSAAVSCFVLERACAHAIAGRVAREADLTTKLKLGSQPYEHLLRADSLRAYLVSNAFIGPARFEHAVENQTKELKELDALGGIEIECLSTSVRHDLKRIYGQLKDDPADPAVRRIARLNDDALEAVTTSNSRSETIAGQTSRAVNLNGSTLDGLGTWQPLDRVPVAARPHNRDDQHVQGAGSLRRQVDPTKSLDDLAIHLHGFVNAEFANLELATRNSYEHPDLPWQFHIDMAKQASDESRHIRMLLQLINHSNEPYTTEVMSALDYEQSYAFRPCDPGSRKELLWRLLLTQTFRETGPLDSFDFEVRRRTYLGQPELVRVFDLLLSDEVHHVKAGLKWSRYLCGGNKQHTMMSRAIAHAYNAQQINERRDDFVRAHPSQAIEELRELSALFEELDESPIQMTFNRKAYTAAGFTSQEVDQFLAWGYIKPDQQEAN